MAALQVLDYFDDEILSAFEGYSCDECGSGLIMPSIREGDAIDANYICKSCEKILQYEEIVSATVADHYSHEVYLSHTDGGDYSLADCPECGGIYLYTQGICASCRHTVRTRMPTVWFDDNTRRAIC